MFGKLSVYAFKLMEDGQNSTSFVNLLSLIENQKLDQRLRPVGSMKVQIEDIKVSDNLWYIDFTRFRDTSGPGKGDGTKPSQPFDFGNGETFCEQTALLYDPDTGYAIVQYNHIGVKHGAITQYFSEYIEAENNLYELLPKYNDNAMRKFEKRKGLKKITAKIDTREVTKEDFEAGTALYDALSIGDESGAETIEIVISAGRKKDKMLNKAADKLTEVLTNLSGQKPDAVDKFEASYVDKVESKVRALDLLGERLSHRYSDLPLDKGQRISQEDRYRALTRSFKTWKAQGNIR